MAIQSDGATYRLELALEKWRPNSVPIFFSVFAIGERALERQSWRAKSVNFGFVLAIQSLQGTDILNSHFTNAIAKDVADLSASEQHCSPTSRSFDIGSKC